MRSTLIAAVLGLCALGALAQSAMDDRSGETTLACLQRPAAPKYPENALERRTSGFYRMQLRFTEAKRAPEVQVLFAAGSAELQDEAEQYAKQFRLPCLQPGSTVALLQEINFRAISDGGIDAPTPVNLPQPPSSRFLQCLRTPPDAPRLNDAVQLQAFKRELKNGNLVAELTFTAPDQPPQAKVVYDTLNRRHRDDILRYVEEYRVPCMEAGQRFAMQQTFQVNFDNNRNFVFKDTGLVNFLGQVKDLEARPVNFQLDTMGCPFRLHFRLGRPAIENTVTESGERNPNRRAFIAWLEQLELALTREQFENLLGAEMFIDVPCGIIKLG
ncbi:hypothetical protein [Pelomonas cellulosilytica]|uniref:TonB C-terminal domain-containing protein n=1 Tax=Pelomonas cellulosilytica TaxID=2906762 RepID=A0ABS8XMJ9_9BURK|nr:hypothetical protein [Pelomonas sp. P8]MCE4553999.1 hypothetical protein [Pelomonas sp. P8]